MSSSDDVSKVLLDAARAAYERRGYLGTTIKGVAAAAGVAPDVAMRYYRNREQLFAAAMRLPFDPATSIAQLLAPGVDGMGERLVRITLRMLDDPETRDQLAEMVRAGAGASKATSSLREFLESAVVDRVVAVLGVPDARMRVSLATSYLLGVASMRYVLKIEPIASATEDELVALVAPAVQAALTTPTQPTKAQTAKAQNATASKATAQKAEPGGARPRSAKPAAPASEEQGGTDAHGDGAPSA